MGSGPGYGADGMNAADSNHDQLRLVAYHEAGHAVVHAVVGRDAEVAEHVSQGFDRYRAIFLAAAKRGQEDGSMRLDESAEVLADYLVASMSGLRTMVKAGKDLEVLRGMVAMVTSAL